MSELIGRIHRFRENLIAVLITQSTSLAQQWIASEAFSRVGSTLAIPAETRVQAELFLHALSEGLRRDDERPLPDLPGQEAALLEEFPAVYRASAMLVLAEIIAEHVRAPIGDTLSHLQRALAFIPVTHEQSRLFNERLGRLNQLSWMLNTQRDEDAILALTLTEAPALVGAASSAIWLWDADQQAPVMMVTVPEQTVVSQPAQALLDLLRQTCANCCAFSIDSGESDDTWPLELRYRPVAFIPMPVQGGCMGILTIHHVEGGRFSHDDILVLSSLGNLASTALRNVQLYTNERHLVKLLQTSIRQVGVATANRSDQPEEFIHSLLHVAEGLTRADAVCAILEIEENDTPLIEVSGPLAMSSRESLVTLTQQLQERISNEILPFAGAVSEVFPGTTAHQLLRPYFAAAEISLSGQRAGIVIALSESPFAEDQVTFLCTMAEQIGVGAENRKQSTNMERLLFELSNVNYVSEVITSTFDPHRIFSTICQAASQALRAPIVLCGWLEEDGSIRVMPDTTIGIPPDIAAHLSLTYNNIVIRSVLDKRAEVSSRTMGKRAPSAFPKLRRLQVQDWVCVPMMVKPRARGIMLVADTRPREFSNREIALLSTYANQAALAMENSLLYEQVDHQLQQMEQLYQMTRSIGSTLERDAILQELLQAATTALKVPVAIICLHEGESGVQQVEASSGIDPASLLTLRIEPGEGILGVVGQRGGVITSSNLASDGRSTILRDLARVEKLVSSVTVPLQVQGVVLGTLTVISREAREFTPANEQFLQAMATEAAVAVQNAHLYEQERERTHGLRKLVGEVSGRVATTLDLLNELLEVIRDTEPTLAGIERTRLRLESIAAVQQGISDDDPTTVDMKEAMTWLAASRSAQYHVEGHDIDLSVTGAHLKLPSRHATALALLIHEWMQAAMTRLVNQPPGQVVIAFQQLGREILVHVEDSADWRGEQAPVNHAIITLVSRILPGTVTETFEGGIHRVRFRFNRPT